MSFERAFQDRIDELASRPAARMPATLGEIWRTQWEASGLDTLGGVGRPRVDAFAELVDGLERYTGKSLPDIERDAGIDLSAATSFDERVTLLGRVAQGLPEHHRDALTPLLDVEGNARKKAQTLQRTADDVSAASYGLTAMGVGFMAGAARQMIEPVNVASMALGAPVGAGLARFLLTEAVVNAGAQAVQEPFIQSGRASLGLEAGLGEAATNIAVAGVAGAGFAGLMRAGGWAWRQFTGGRAGEAAAPAAPPEAARLDLAPEDFDAARRWQEARDVVDRQAPDQNARAVHTQAEGVEQMARYVETQSRLDMAAEAAGAMPLPMARIEPTGVLVGIDAPNMPVHRVSTSAGDRIELKPIVVEAASLRASNDPAYPAELQPRDRDRAASQAQITEIASRLDPERLGISSEADRGAPIVGDDGVVESGNGRILAIRRAYEQGGPQAQAYRDFVAAQGVDVSGFREPVLVRQRLTELDPVARRDFTTNANVAATLAFSAPERALADARLVSPEMLAQIAVPNDLGAAGNVPFVRAFVARLPQAEQGALADAQGRLSAEGLRRVRAAIVGRAYGDAELLARITEAADDNVRSLSNALTAAAPEWAAMRADIEAGRVPASLDVTGQLMEAVRLTADMRAKGMKFDSWMAQLDAFDTPAPATVQWMRLFHGEKGRAASAERVTEGLKSYSVNARKVEASQGLDLGLPEVTAHDIQALVLNRTADAGGERAQLSDGAGDGAGRAGGAGRGADDAGGAAEGAVAGGGRAASDEAGDGLGILPERSPDALASTAATLRQWKGSQPGRTVAELYAIAPTRQADLAKAGREVADELGLTFADPGVKNQADAEAKLSRKGYDDAAQITDVVRGAFVLEGEGQRAAVVAAMRQRFELIDEGVNVAPLGGYVDQKLIVRFPDGLLGEVQIVGRAMWDAKKTGGDALFKQARDLPRGSAERVRLDQEMRELYAAAAELDRNASTGSGGASGNKAANASSDTTLPLSDTSKALTSDQEPRSSAQASISDVSSTAGRPSQSTNLRDDVSGMGSRAQNAEGMSSGKMMDGEQISPSAARDGLDFLTSPKVAEDLAAATRAMEQSGLREFVLPGPDGKPRTVTAASLMDDLKDDAGAAAALRACMGGVS